jgi:hypothetical protein
VRQPDNRKRYFRSDRDNKLQRERTGPVLQPNRTAGLREPEFVPVSAQQPAAGP